MLNPEIQKSTNWIVAVITDLKRCVSHEIFTQIVPIETFQHNPFKRLCAGSL